MRKVLLLVLAAAGCTRDVTRSEELAMNCEMITDHGLLGANVWRCENTEALCYVYREGIHCERTVRPAAPLALAPTKEPAAPPPAAVSDWRKGYWRRVGAILELKPEDAPTIRLRVKDWER